MAHLSIKNRTDSAVERWRFARQAVDFRPMSSSESIAETLRARILRGLRAGTLSAGDRLPSARELVDEFQVEHRRILAAYRILASEGLVEMRQRGGVYVAKRDSRGDLRTVPVAWIVETLSDAYSREIAMPELAGLLRRSLETLRLKAVVVSSSEEQSARIARELMTDFGILADGIQASQMHLGRPVMPSIRRADMLITTVSHVDEVAKLAEQLGKPWFAIDLRPDFVLGEWAMLLTQPVWAIVGSVEFADVLRQAFADLKGIENLHILVHERDDLAVIPHGAPIYVTHRVREALADTTLNGRLLPVDRVIALHSTRQIVDFIVQANLRAMHALRSIARQPESRDDENR